MHGIFLTLLTWVHLLSAVLWIGGIFFILYVALPSAKKALDQPAKLMGAVSGRFVPLANISILLIIVTGIVMSMSAHDYPDLLRLNGLRAQALFLKVMVALIMTGIHFYRGLILAPKIARFTAEGGQTDRVGKLQGFSLNLVKANLFLGIAVLLLTGMLDAYRT